MAGAFRFIENQSLSKSQNAERRQPSNATKLSDKLQFVDGTPAFLISGIWRN
jgi:hypothetical protein